MSPPRLTLTSLLTPSGILSLHLSYCLTSGFLKKHNPRSINTLYAGIPLATSVYTEGAGGEAARPCFPNMTLSASGGRGDGGRRALTMKINCWEFKKCGRQPGGAKAAELGVCPATVSAVLNGAHGGQNAGRACWVIAGSDRKSVV